ncbi:MAG: class IV adenylate cyclase [Phycisphaerales bacterium]|jgi:adenylate cyclase class 2
MCTEIEAKLKVDSLAEIKRKLTELGAEPVAEQLQTDQFFDNVDTGLAKTDRCLRLRRQVVDNIERFFLTYKGAKEKSDFKKRQEIELEISNAESARKLLSALGYEQVLTIEKKRHLWRIGECKVTLDKLPLLGDFIEIEGPDDKSISDVQKNLGLSEVPHIPKSYASLIKDQLQQSGKDIKVVFFESSEAQL